MAADKWLAEIGPVRITELTTRDVEAVLADHDHLARSSLRHLRSALSQAINFAMRRDDVGRNVSLAAMMPVESASTEPCKSLDADEAAKLFDLCSTDAPVFCVSLVLGLRPGEATALRWDWIDLDAEVLHVRRTVRGRQIVDEPKTAGAVRSLAMPTRLTALLRRHRAEQLATRMAAERCDSCA